MEQAEIEDLDAFYKSSEITLDRVLIKRYVELLLDWNVKVNLISRGDVKNVWKSHIIHSLSILKILNIEPGTRVLDLGTGGGLPGIPISIARPDLSMTLLDSIRKKTAAVQNIVDSLSLPHVDVITARAEEIPDRKKKWDLVISRAVAPLEKLIGWSKSLLKYSQKKMIGDSQNQSWETPALIALKGGDLQKEISDARNKWHPKDIQIFDISLSGTGSVDLQDKKIILVKL